MKECLNPNCKVNSNACVSFELPNRCHREKFCNWQKGLNLKQERIRQFTKTHGGINI